MGVYILYTIIFPVIKLITGGDINPNYSAYQKYFNVQETISEIDAPKVEDTYKIEIEKKLKSDIEQMGYNVSKVNVEFSLEEGIIKHIELQINSQKKQEDKMANEIHINKIDIGEEKQKQELDTEETKKIKQKINEDYGVDTKNITVNSI